MVTTLPKKECLQRGGGHKRLTLYGEDGNLYYAGGAPVLTDEIGFNLYPSFLDEIGRDTFAQKIETRDWGQEDTDRTAMFLMRHGIQPSAENCFRLLMGAGIDMVVRDKLARLERRGKPL